MDKLTQPHVLFPVIVVLFIVGTAVLMRSKASRLIKYDVNSIVSMAFMFGILFAINVIVVTHPEIEVGGHRIPLQGKLDVTANHRLTITPKTVEIVRSLKQDVQVIAFFSMGSPEERSAKEILEQYATQSTHFQYHFSDPIRDPMTAGRYKELVKVLPNGPKRIAPGTIVMDIGDRHIATSIPVSASQISEAEENLTNALVEVFIPDKKVVYFTKGHGEKTPEEQGELSLAGAKEAMEKSIYTVKTMAVAETKDVPPDASAIVICGPEKDFSKEEIETLKRYVSDRGGGLVVMSDPPFVLPNLEGLLASCGLSVGRDLVFDTKIPRPEFVTLVDDFSGIDPITSNFRLQCLFWVARSVDTSKKPIKDVNAQVFAKTSDSSWAIHGISGAIPPVISLDKTQDKPGPIVVGVNATIGHPNATPSPDAAVSPSPSASPKSEDKDAHVVLFGNSRFVGGSSFQLMGNGDLFLRSVGWAAKRDKAIDLGITSVSKPKPPTLTYEQMQRVQWISMILIPGLLAMAGILVFMVFKPN